jgi:hypothetical protein
LRSGFYIFEGILAKMKKCPRCKLPQNGIYKCQYCGYDLPQDKKRHVKITRKRVKDIIGGLKKGPDRFKK